MIEDLDFYFGTIQQLRRVSQVPGITQKLTVAVEADLAFALRELSA